MSTHQPSGRARRGSAGPLDADIGVVGVGTMGSMALWQAVRHGYSAIGFEQYYVGHQAGAGAGEARQFRDDFLEDEVTDLMRHAVAGYRALEADSGMKLLHLNGGLTIGPESSDLVETLVRRIRAQGARVHTLSPRVMSQRYPQHRLDSGDIAIWNARAGFVTPEHAIVAAVETACRAGARVVSHATVDGIEAEGGSVRVRAGSRTWRVAKLIVTAGPWAWRMLPAHPAAAGVGRLLITWFPTAAPELFTANRFPTFSRIMEGHHVYGFPSLWHGSVRVGLAGPREFLTGPEDLDARVVPEAELEVVSRLVEQGFPDLLPRVVRASVHVDGYSRDGQPVVGGIGESGDVVVAAGCSGRGFKMAPVIGRVLVDLATTGRSTYDIGAWAPGRFAGA